MLIGDEVIKRFDSYSRRIAAEGQISTQVPQSTHFSLMIFALSPFMQIASAGHASIQDSQATH
jgi:hypothetical protein